MADDAAHITPGPPPPSAGAVASAPAPEGSIPAGGIATQPPPDAVAAADAVSEEIDVVGRSAAVVAAQAKNEPVAVLVGAAAAANEEHAAVGAGGVASARYSVGSDSGFPTGEDAPMWSFRDRRLRSATPPVAIDDAQVELPFTQPAEPARPPQRPLPTFGPVGRARSTILVPLLAVATLGVYALVWHHRVNRELEEFDPKLRVRPGRSVIAVTIPWLLGLLVTLSGAALIVAARLSIHIPFDTHVTTAQAFYLLAGLAAVPYLALVLPFSLIAVVMTLERIRCVEEHVGTTTDRQVRPAAIALLLAIPVVGGLALLGVEQGRLNAIWDAVAPAGFFHN